MARMQPITSFDDVKRVLEPYILVQNTMTGAYSLSRVKQFMSSIGNPQLKYKIVHVAGTSGKTSTAYYVAGYLSATNKKTGLMVSPHIDSINERVQVNMIPLEESEYCKQFGSFIELVQKSNVKLTYFEVLTGFAYWYFAQAKIDYVVVEVGLGGLLDATNIVHRADKVCVITDIGLDHTNILGKSIAEIATQKAGIIGPSNPVFMNEQQAVVNEVIAENAIQQQADLHQIQPQPDTEVAMSLPLFQRRNWYLARQVFSYIAKRDKLPEVSDGSIISTLIPARMETVEIGNKIVILDGAHNEQKMQALVSSLKYRYPHQPVAVLASFVKSQSSRTKGALYELLPYASRLIITSFGGDTDGPKHSVNPTKIAEYCHAKNYDNWQVITHPTEAFYELLRQKESIVVVTGSFYLFNHIRPLVNKMLQKQG